MPSNDPHTHAPRTPKTPTITTGQRIDQLTTQHPLPPKSNTIAHHPNQRTNQPKPKQQTHKTRTTKQAFMDYPGFLGGDGRYHHQQHHHQQHRYPSQVSHIDTPANSRTPLYTAHTAPRPISDPNPPSINQPQKHTPCTTTTGGHRRRQQLYNHPQQPGPAAAAAAAAAAALRVLLLAALRERWRQLRPLRADARAAAGARPGADDGGAAPPGGGVAAAEAAVGFSCFFFFYLCTCVVGVGGCCTTRQRRRSSRSSCRSSGGVGY